MNEAIDPAPFRELVRNRTGLTLESTAEGNVQTAINRRMAAAGEQSVMAYYSRLVADRDEFHEFVTLLTVNETYFYREPNQLALLVEHIIPRLLAEGQVRPPFRILSAGCSTGEEPYSIAIALAEAFGDDARGIATIIGGDIDLHALAKARAARFSRFSFRNLDAGLFSRYFRSCGAGCHALDERIAGMVRFQHFNLLAGSFAADLQDLDVVFFRNVSIYFDEPARRAILLTFKDAMRDGACLLTSAAETMSNDLGIFQLVEKQGVFHFTKTRWTPTPRFRRTERQHAVSNPPHHGETARRAPRRTEPPAPPGLGELRDLVRAKRFDAALAGLTAARLAAGDEPSRLALEGYVRFLMHDLGDAKALAERALAIDGWCVDALFLLGLVAKWRDEPEAAIDWLKKAVYSRHECWPAHFYLGELYRVAGRREPARRAYRLALRQIDGCPDPDGGLALPLELPFADVRFLCQRHAASGRKE